jgi:hypothetical protein
MRQRDMFRQVDEEDAEEERRGVRYENKRCTPELLLAFLQKHRRETGKRSPTLQEIKKEFGGILGAFRSAWELARQGKLRNGCLMEEKE